MNLTQLLHNIQPQGGFDSWFLWKLCVDVGKGLEALHLEGVVHGDIKLDNVLSFFQEKGDAEVVAKICDFGFSGQDHERVPGASTVYRGTSGWRPPEIIRTQSQRTSMPVGTLRSCDVFAYGLLVWSVFARHGGSPLGLPGMCEGKEEAGRALRLAYEELRSKNSIRASDIYPPILLLQTSLQLDAKLRHPRPWFLLQPLSSPFLRGSTLWYHLQRASLALWQKPSPEIQYVVKIREFQRLGFRWEVPSLSFLDFRRGLFSSNRQVERRDGFPKVMSLNHSHFELKVQTSHLYNAGKPQFLHTPERRNQRSDLRRWYVVHRSESQDEDRLTSENEPPLEDDLTFEEEISHLKGCSTAPRD